MLKYWLKNLYYVLLALILVAFLAFMFYLIFVTPAYGTAVMCGN